MAGSARAKAAPAGQDEAASCPSEEQVELLRQWDGVQSGLRRLNEQVLEDVHRATGLAPSSFQVLWFLLNAPEKSAPMGQLSRTLGFTTAGTTKVADRLSEAGLMERRPHAVDRRVTLACLTGRGRATATKAALTLADALQERVAGPLGPGGLGVLAEHVTRVDPEAPEPRPCAERERPA
ncbi:MarR family winged helix-turn-helix transcriptional regulator [Streptomyces sp. NPDC007088]|uniref:MarR family winged helix-turn-helix transcriptional regulator n=1 Tax=Streptomyces sp. NPDC007088 TaxID=3364773 RepID=UPI0036AE35AA